MENELIYLAIASSSSTVAVVSGLAAWLGKVWASRIQDSEKNKYAVELEKLRGALAISQAQNERNSGAQFKLYNALWSELQDLKIIGDHLWSEASIENYGRFISALNHADQAIEKGRLILFERDYLRLRQAVDAFKRYELGKKRLMDIKTEAQLIENYQINPRDAIDRQVRQNLQHKEYYENLLEDLINGFRRRLGLNV